jgi:hypothetical protein
MGTRGVPMASIVPVQRGAEAASATLFNIPGKHLRGTPHIGVASRRGIDRLGSEKFVPHVPSNSPTELGSATLIAVCCALLGATLGVAVAVAVLS